jgi:DNA replication protein DnaC
VSEQLQDIMARLRERWEAAGCPPEKPLPPPDPTHQTTKAYLRMIPRLYHDAAYETWEAHDDATADALVKVRAWEMSESRGLYLMAPCGYGKTFLACACGRSVAEQGLEVRFYSVPSMLERMRQAIGHGQTYQVPTLDSALTVLDDMGVEQGTEWVRDRLFLMLDYFVTRLENSRLIITSNLDLDEMASRMGDRLASRIIEVCDVVEIGGSDYRIRKAARRP